jgi:hypothetical protein
MSFERFHHPRESEFTAAHCRIQGAIGRAGTVADYLQRKYHDRPVIADAVHQSIAALLNPLDPGLRRPTYEPESFHDVVAQGMVMGVELSRGAYQSQRMTPYSIYAAANAVLPAEKPAAHPVIRRTQAQNIYDFGQSGLDQLGRATIEWLDAQEYDVANDIRLQPFYRIAAGIGISATRVAFDQWLARDRAELERQLTDDEGSSIDWDAAAQSMYRPKTLE